MTKNFSSLLILLSFILISGCGQSDKLDLDEIQEQIFSIRNGQTDQNNLYPNVIRLNINNSILCSGTIIDANVILTAAHCVNTAQNAQAVRVVNAAGRLVRSTDIVLHPTYSSNVLAGIRVSGQTFPLISPDLAIIGFEDSLGFEARPLARNRLSSNAPITMVGYGANETNAIGVRRIGQATFHRHYGSYAEGYKKINVDGSFGAVSTNANQMICGGDSGGPAFNRQGELVGVASATMIGSGNSNITCVKRRNAGYVFVGRYLNWIESVSGQIKERLEPTLYSWTNPTLAYDTNNDGRVSAIDALLVINFINKEEGSEISVGQTPPPKENYYLDVSKDYVVSSNDAQLVINYLNRQRRR